MQKYYFNMEWVCVQVLVCVLLAWWLHALKGYAHSENKTNFVELIHAFLDSGMKLGPPCVTIDHLYLLSHHGNHALSLYKFLILNVLL